jgi:S-formylglutathione hydrolase
MRFSVYLPPAALHENAPRLPALIYLAGLTCTEETFMVKAGAQRLASELGLVLVAPDTSPRGAKTPGEADDWDFGLGAGFWLDATEPDWRTHWRMESYVCQDLIELMATQLPVDRERIGIFGHSMGGHGALTLALRHPDLFRSVSAFAPISAPSSCPWGEKAFTGYLGADRERWREHDAVELMSRLQAAPFPQGILVDQGLADKFLATQLHPHLLEAACDQVGQPLTLRRQEGYDHGYYFIQSFVDDHLRFHAEQLGA